MPLTTMNVQPQRRGGQDSIRYTQRNSLRNFGATRIYYPRIAMSRTWGGMKPCALLLTNYACCRHLWRPWRCAHEFEHPLRERNSMPSWFGRCEPSLVPGAGKRRERPVPSRRFASARQPFSPRTWVVSSAPPVRPGLSTTVWPSRRAGARDCAMSAWKGPYDGHLALPRSVPNRVLSAEQVWQRDGNRITYRYSTVPV